jgi:hypothetical protein
LPVTKCHELREGVAGAEPSGYLGSVEILKP